MRTSTCGQLEGTAGTGAMPPKSSMRSAPGSAMFGNRFSACRTLDSGQAHCSQFWNHAARLQDPREPRGAGREELPWLDADLAVQLLPAFCAGGITRRISTVPPHQEMVRVGRPAWLLVPIQRLQLPQDFGNASGISVHTLRHSIAWRRSLSPFSGCKRLRDGQDLKRGSQGRIVSHGSLC